MLIGGSGSGSGVVGGWVIDIRGLTKRESGPDFRFPDIEVGICCVMCHVSLGCLAFELVQ